MPVYPNLTYDEYAALPGERSSRLKLMGESPLHYIASDYNDTASRGMLRAIHCLVLEPHRFNDEFAVCTMRRDARMKAYQDFMAEHEGKTHLSETESASARNVADGYLRHEEIQALTQGKFDTELTLTWTHEPTRTPCKARLDFLRIDGTTATIADLKSYGTTDPRMIAARIVRNGAHIQAAHYIEAVQANYPQVETIRYLIASAETKSPFDVAVVELTEAARDIGTRIRADLLQRISEARKANKWPGRVPSIIPLDLPAYADTLGDPTEGDEDEDAGLEVNDAFNPWKE